MAPALDVIFSNCKQIESRNLRKLNVLLLIQLNESTMGNEIKVKSKHEYRTSEVTENTKEDSQREESFHV